PSLPAPPGSQASHCGICRTPRRPRSPTCLLENGNDATFTAAADRSRHPPRRSRDHGHGRLPRLTRGLTRTALRCPAGSNVQGAKFARELIRSGVDAVLTYAAGWEQITEALCGSEDDRARLAGVAALIVEAPRAVLGFVSAAVYGTTSVPELIGVTGTNGKTTTTYLA